MNRPYHIGLIACCAVLLFFAGKSMAAKPLDVIQLSNGYPSGEHFNLNIHGKNAEYSCGSAVSGGGSVFIPEHGEATIEYVSNKKSSVTELTVKDACGGFAGPNDNATVQLPSESQGYYVFAVLKGKPQNGNLSEESSVMLWPNPVLEVCNDTLEPNPEFPTYTSCPDSGGDDETVMALGLVTNTDAYEMTNAGLIRFDNSIDSKGKGKSKAIDITGLFMWTGYVCDAILDSNGDGVLGVEDLDIDLDGDYDVDDADLATFMENNESCTYHDNEWVFNIADLVVQDQKIQNDGGKLLKIRFYPVATTYFVR